METLELHEFKDNFSRFVVSRTSETTHYHFEHTSDQFKEASQEWLKSPEVNATAEKLTRLVNQGVLPYLRPQHWKDACSVGADNLGYTLGMILDMGILVPSSIPRTIFGGKRAFPTYNLSPDGEKACSTILYSLYHVHPDMQFAPLLPPLTALFLHFMDESDCYTCMHALVNSRRSILDQSRWDYEVMAQTFQDSLKLYSKASFQQITKAYTVQTGKTYNKNEIILRDWLIWMFHHIDFWTLVCVVDSFLVQGPYVLIRLGLIVFSKFANFIEKEGQMSGKCDLEDLFKSFAQQMPLRGCELLQTAFKIRRFSRKQLEQRKQSSITSLKEVGILPVQSWDPVPLRELTLFAVTGTDLLSQEMWELLCSWLPVRVRIKRPFCLFTTNDAGYSIKTLYINCEGHDETILLIETCAGEIIGVFASMSWSERKSGQKSLSYFGTGETFVFRLSPNPQRYFWSGLRKHRSDSKTRDLFMAGDDKCLMVGGSGCDHAIWLDDELKRGQSGPTETFGNVQLTEDKDFVCNRVEVLGFATEN